MEYIGMQCCIRVEKFLGQLKPGEPVFSSLPESRGEQFLILWQKDAFFSRITRGGGCLLPVILIYARDKTLVNGNIFFGQIVVIMWILKKVFQLTVTKPYSKL